AKFRTRAAGAARARNGFREGRRANGRCGRGDHLLLLDQCSKTAGAAAAAPAHDHSSGRQHLRGRQARALPDPQHLGRRPSRPCLFPASGRRARRRRAQDQSPHRGQRHLAPGQQCRHQLRRADRRRGDPRQPFRAGGWLAPSPPPCRDRPARDIARRRPHLRREHPRHQPGRGQDRDRRGARGGPGGRAHARQVPPGPGRGALVPGRHRRHRLQPGDPVPRADGLAPREL
ncbi:MAG: hypothetical protein AVDCRST_MAG23-1882, partial [uncultured Sphingosinicella sp.]